MAYTPQYPTYCQQPRLELNNAGRCYIIVGRKTAQRWNETKKMERRKDTVNHVTDPRNEDQTAMEGAKPSSRTGIVAGIRMKIRRLFKKEDPNIYPFF